MFRRYLLAALVITILLAGISLTLANKAPLVTTATPNGGVKVIRGPTPIQEGEATSTEDLTLMNEYLAVTFGIGTLPPWGVTRGHIIDMAPVIDGVPGSDMIAQFSFPVDGWGQWATFDTIEVVENTSTRAIVKATGYWKSVKVEITYTLEAGKNYLHVVTTLTNEGAQAYEEIVSGYAISLKKGWTFTPGFGTGKQYAPTLKEDLGIFDDWVSGYYENFAVGILAPYYTHLSTSTGWVDPFTIHTINPGETKVFEGYVIVEPVGDVCKILADILEIKGESSGTVAGSVTANGNPVPNPVVIVNKEGKPYCWGVGSEDGSYTLTLPPGTYTLQATAKGYGPSSTATVEVVADTTVTQDFTDVTTPGSVVLNVVRSDTGQPVDAKILISGGELPIVRYLQVTTAYTDPEDIGTVELSLPPGTYTLTVSYGGGFISKPVVLEDVNVESGGTLQYDVSIDVLVNPNEKGWYSADLHHHSNILDGRTPPEWLVVAQSAAGLDFIFVSDHDSVVNHDEIASWAETRGLPFIPSVEVSPNWAHFNPYPLPLGQYETIRGTACEMFEEMRDLGAIVIRVNHPYTGGYFISWEKGEIPGDYCIDWDVAEINGWWGSTDNKTLMKMWELWNKGQRYYLTAGSDVHDIWASPYSGYPRVYAYLPTEQTPEAFAYAEKLGHTFISYGPLIFMDPLPGYTIAVQGDENITLNLELVAVDGLSKVIVYGMGERIFETSFPDNPMEVTLTVEIPADQLFDTNTLAWVQVGVWDADGDLALTNPVWIDKQVEKPVVTETVTETETTTQTLTETTTETETTTVTSTTTETSVETVVETVTRWDISAGIAILALIIGFGLAYVLFKKK